MHAVIITFKTSAPPASLEEPFRSFAEELLGVDGFVSEVWLNDGETLGGSHVFDSEEAANADLQSELVAGQTANQAFHDFEVRTFAVIDDRTAVTARSPPPPDGPAARSVPLCRVWTVSRSTDRARQRTCPSWCSTAAETILGTLPQRSLRSSRAHSLP